MVGKVSSTKLLRDEGECMKGGSLKPNMANCHPPPSPLPDTCATVMRLRI